LLLSPHVRLWNPATRQHEMNMGPFEALCVDWHDGDTGHFNLDVGFDIIISAYDLDGRPKLSARVFGINAPELRRQEPIATQAKEYAERICPPGSKCIILSHDWDKYGGRFDASITLPTPIASVDGEYIGDDFAQLMLHSQLGVVPV